MHIDAVRELRLQPCDIAVVPTGELLTFSWSREGMHFDAYDGDLETLWSLNLGPRALGFRLDKKGTLWVIDRAGASAFTMKGEVMTRIDAPALNRMEVAALAFVDDDLVFAYQHGEDDPPDRPGLVRVTRKGAVRWSSRLSTEAVVFGGDPSDRRHAVDARDRLHPTSWVCSYRKAGDLTISDDRLLAVYSDMPRTGLAIGYVVSLDAGEVRYATQRGPIECVAPAGDGAFLIGYMGYGAFETSLYDRDGSVPIRWESHGHFVISDHDIRVIELENITPSRCRLARLMPGGRVVRGDLLEGYYTSEPYVRDDGRILFAREGMMIAADDLMIDERVRIVPAGVRDAFHTRVLAGRDGVFTTWSVNCPAPKVETPEWVGHTSGIVHLSI
jgi:hypothetical protein